LDSLLREHHERYTEVFGAKNVTVNFHKALHLPEQIQEYGAPKFFSVRLLSFLVIAHFGSLLSFQTRIACVHTFAVYFTETVRSLHVNRHVHRRG